MLRPLRLARIAAEAEGLRLRRQAQRTVVRLAIGCIALIFLAWALAFAHVAVWFALRVNAGLTSWATALIIAGGDMVIALFLVLIAARSAPGRVEQEALAVRRRALENAASSLALTGMLMPALRLVLNLLRRPR